MQIREAITDPAQRDQQQRDGRPVLPTRSSDQSGPPPLVENGRLSGPVSDSSIYIAEDCDTHYYYG